MALVAAKKDENECLLIASIAESCKMASPKIISIFTLKFINLILFFINMESIPLILHYLTIE